MVFVQKRRFKKGIKIFQLYIVEKIAFSCNVDKSVLRMQNKKTASDIERACHRCFLYFGTCKSTVSAKGYNQESLYAQKHENIDKKLENML